MTIGLDATIPGKGRLRVDGLPSFDFDAGGVSQIQDGIVTLAKLERATRPVGVGQVRQNMGASRTYGVTYKNSTGQIIRVRVDAVIAAGTNSVTYVLGGDTFYGNSASQTNRALVEFDVGINETYLISGTAISSILSWWEIR